MSPFPNFPHPERFRNYEDAVKFMEAPDYDLCIPVFVEDDTPHGKRVRFNPEYLNAPYEQSIVWDKKWRILTKR